MSRRLLAVAVLVLGACASTGTHTPPAPQAGQSTRTAVLMAINDVYRIEGLEGGRVAGLARVRSLRKELERDHPDMLFLHGGDFLFPSFASRMYSGEQMVAVLNGLDGDTSAFDDRMIAVFGNHELEKGKMKDAPMLAKRIGESQFRWLGSNITFTTGGIGDGGRPLVDSPNLIKTALVESGGIAIGIFGLTIPTDGIQYADFAGPVGVARDLTAQLRAQGAEVVIALTHLNAADDREILETLGDAGPDLIVGGHDHEKMAIQVGRRLILKADADARTATVIHLSLAPDGKLDVTHEFRPLYDATPPPDPDTLALVADWQARHEREFCAKANAAPGCLEELYGSTQTPLEAEETKIRNQETSLGDWVADLMKKEMAACGAQVAFINSGSLRLNQDLPAGTKITRRHVEELFGYETPLRLIRIDGATLQQVVEHATRGWPGSGTWLQIAGFAWVHDTAGKKATGLTLLTPQGPRPVRPDEEILAAVDDYLVNPEIGDQDGYLMLDPSRIVRTCAADGRDLKQAVVDALRAANPEGIAPKAEGRICQPGRPDGGRPCLADAAGGR